MSPRRIRITDQYALVHRKGSANWYLEWREAGQDKQRRSCGTGSTEQALVRARELILERLTITQAAPAAITIADVLDRYRLQHGAKLASADTMRRALVLWKGYWGDKTVDALTVDAQEAFVKHLRGQKYSEGYVRRVLSVGKAALNRAYRRGMITAVPFVELPPIGEGYPHYATRDELVRLLNVKMPEHIWTYVMIRLCTGCRGDAALDLQPFQVDTTAKLIRLNPPGRTQTKKYRATVPLTDTLALVLADCSAASYYVNWHGAQINSLKTTWRKLKINAKLPLHWAPKILRHTVATELRRRGVPNWEAAGLLGHARGSTTDTYAKFDPDYLGKARTALDDWMRDLSTSVPRLASLLARAATVAAGAHLRAVK